MTNQDSLTQNSNNDAPVRALRPISFYIIVLMVLLADQLSKSWIQKQMAYGQSRTLFGDAFRLTLTQNTGGAWGLLPQGNHWFIAFACGAVIALLVAYHRMPKVELFVGSAFALALGGALGNVADRIRHGFVVDFLHAKFINFPVFNLADTAITFGIVFLLIHLIITSREEAAEAKRADNDPPAAGVI